MIISVLKCFEENLFPFFVEFITSQIDDAPLKLCHEVPSEGHTARAQAGPCRVAKNPAAHRLVMIGDRTQ